MHTNRPYRAAILDLDGVITQTARLHARAWKRMFDAYLEQRPAREGEEHDAFDIEADYRAYIDGKPRYDGVRSFLKARGIQLPEGEPDDPPGRETVCGLGNRKNELFHELLRSEGVEVFADAVEQLRAWRRRGVKTAMVSSSRNGTAILEAAGLKELFDVTVDGEDAARLDLDGKPAPDVFIEAARRLGCDPPQALIVEDAVAGVEAGRAGGFGLVVGVARDGNAPALRAHGADVVVRTLTEIDDAMQERMAERELRPWELIYTDWDPEEQPLREALCTLGNGYVATRGAFEEVQAGGPHYPGTYLAGGYNRLETEVAGTVLENEDLVNWPNWLPLTFRTEDGDWFDLDAVDVLDFSQRLDVYRGVLERTVRFRDARARAFTLVSRRIVHMAEPHLAAVEWRLTPHDWSGRIEIRSALDGTVANENVERYGDLSNRHLEVLDTGCEAEDIIYLTVRTNQSKVGMTQAARTCVFEGDAEVPTRRTGEDEGDCIAQRLLVSCHRQKELRIEKVVALYTSRDFAISEPSLAARTAVRRAGSFAHLLRTHERTWQHLWDHADIVLYNGDTATQFILRLHIFHLLVTTSINTIDLDVGVPSRGWHGEAYRGHILWDELFIFPFLNLRLPEITRSLLMYRYRRLAEARHLACQAGFEGAMFPWQSGSDGREESQVLHLNPRSGRWIPDTSNLQRHVNAAIAYNVWMYYQATGDVEFLSYYGAEMLLSIARFWASIATYNADRSRYEIRGVVGPDEFHTRYPDAGEDGLNNNAYTNVMAAWVLRCACEALQVLDETRRRELMEDLEVTDDERARWDEISRRMVVPFHDEGVISQFEGYEALREFDWDGYREKHGDIHRLDRLLEAEDDDVNRYKASKQADVLMLFYLFSAEALQELFEHMGYAWDPDVIPRTIDYYMHRTSHGSTLSRVVHSWVLARSNREGAWTLFKEALHSDIEDIQGGTTPEGIHLGAMAGTVDLIQRAHMGLEMRDDVLWFNPLLPYELSDVRLHVRYRGHWLLVQLTGAALTVSFDRGWSEAVQIGFRDEVHEMTQGETRTFSLK